MINDTKGIKGTVHLGSEVLDLWNHSLYSIEDIKNISINTAKDHKGGVYHGILNLVES